MAPVDLATVPIANVDFSAVEYTDGERMPDEDQPRSVGDQDGIPIARHDSPTHLVQAGEGLESHHKKEDSEAKTFVASITSVDASGSPVVSVLYHESRAEPDSSSAIKGFCLPHAP